MAELLGGYDEPDSHALAVLLAALSRLPASGRLRLLETVRADASAAGLDPGRWLAEPLARETHPSVVRALLRRLDPTPPGARAFWEVGPDGGRALLTMPGVGGEQLWLEVRWRPSGVEVDGGAGSEQDVARRAEALEEARPRRVGATLAPLIYQLARAGTPLPEQAAAFARLF